MSNALSLIFYKTRDFMFSRSEFIVAGKVWESSLYVNLNGVKKMY